VRPVEGEWLQFLHFDSVFCCFCLFVGFCVFLSGFCVLVSKRNRCRRVTEPGVLGLMCGMALKNNQRARVRRRDGKG
jgi:hypothetical protein